MVFIATRRSIAALVLGHCQQVEVRLLSVGSAVAIDLYELRPHRDLGVVQRGLSDTEWKSRLYAADNAKHTATVTRQHGDFKD